MYCTNEKIADVLEHYMQFWRDTHPEATKEEKNDKWVEIYKHLEKYGIIDDPKYKDYASKKHEEDMQQMFAAQEEYEMKLQRAESTVLGERPAGNVSPSNGGKHRKGKSTNRTPKKRKRK